MDAEDAHSQNGKIPSDNPRIIAGWRQVVLAGWQTLLKANNVALLEAPELALLETADRGEWSPQGPWDAAAVRDRPRARASAGGTIAAQLQAMWFQVLLCVIAGLPLVWPQMPPLTDLGGHLGRFAVQLDGGATASLRQWYSFKWTVIPNLGTDLLMQALAPHMGLEPALKAIVIGIVVVQASGFLVLARVVHGRVPPTTLLALPLVYGYPFAYGFLNFTLCAALGTWALALWIGLDAADDRNGAEYDRLARLGLSRWLIFVPIAAALWICHLEGWALFCIMAAGCEFARRRDLAAERGSAWRAVVMRSAAPLSCLALPCLMFVFWPHAKGSSGFTGEWFNIPAKLGDITMAMRDRWSVWDVSSALLILGMIGWTWSSRAFIRDRRLALAAILAAAAFVLVPKHIGGTSFVDMRLVPIILAIALIAVRPREDCPRRIVEGLAVFALLFVGARFAGNAISMAMFDAQFSADLPVLDSVPRDSLLVTESLKPCVENEPWLRERRTHLAGYALARRHAFANDQWVMAGGQLLRVHAPDMGLFTGDPSQTGSPEACHGRPSAIDVIAHIPRAVRYLWVVQDGVARPYAGWQPIRKSSGSVLYTRD